MWCKDFRCTYSGQAPIFSADVASQTPSVTLSNTVKAYKSVVRRNTVG